MEKGRDSAVEVRSGDANAAEPELRTISFVGMTRAWWRRCAAGIPSLEDPSCLTKWMVSVAVHSARSCLQRRYRGRWLKFFGPDELPEVSHTESARNSDATAELRRTYVLLERLPARERVLFTLRYIEGMGRALSD